MVALQRLRKRYNELKKTYEREKHWRELRGENVPSEQEKELYLQMNRAKQEYETVKSLYGRKKSR